jgi:hypothetical protein
MSFQSQTKINISKSEWHFVWWLSAVVIIITTLPYLVGYLFTPVGTIYNGLHALSPGDVPVYYSYLRQIKIGEFFLYNFFTSEIQTHGTLNLWWLLVGLFGKWFDLSGLITFQVSRILMIPVFIATAYIFFSYFFISQRVRQWTLIFILFSAGVGAYVAPFLQVINPTREVLHWPIDLWITEATTFTALYHSSHMITSLVMLLVILLFIFLGLNQTKIKYALFAGLAGFFYFNFHPYYLPVVYGVALLYFFYLTWQHQKINWQQLIWVGLFIILSLPSAMYHVWLISVDPIIFQRAMQNVTPLSPWLYVFLGYGWLWIGGLASLIIRVKNKNLDNHYVFMLLWLLVNFSLIILPLPFTSRFTQGMHIILVYLTIDALLHLYHYLKSNFYTFYKKIIIGNTILFSILFVLFFSLSNIFQLVRDIYYFTIKPNQTAQIFYLEQGLVDSYIWLDQNVSKQVVLAADIPAKFMPSYAGQIAYVAHAHETNFYYAKAVYLHWFYADNNTENDDKKQAWLHREKIDYVIYSPYEKDLGNFQPQEKNYLYPEFTSGQNTVYKVIN